MLNIYRVDFLSYMFIRSNLDSIMSVEIKI